MMVHRGSLWGCRSLSQGRPQFELPYIAEGVIEDEGGLAGVKMKWAPGDPQELPTVGPKGIPAKGDTIFHVRISRNRVV